MVDAALKALRPALFDWTVHVDQVWAPPVTDAEELHDEARRLLAEHVEDLLHSSIAASPLGVVVLGQAGSGKTHLLGYLRRHTHAQSAFFVLVDMTDVRDFWETVLLGYLRSLQQPMADGRRQLDVWLEGLVERYGSGIARVRDIPSQRPPGLILRCNDIVAAVAQREGADAREHADVLRALILFACTHDDVNDMGYKWLQGIGIDADEKQHFGFREAQRTPSRIVQGLSWLLSLQAPTVLAFDQLDSIVSEHTTARLADPEDLNARQLASLAIVRGISGGLLALRDRTRRTLSVVSSLNATWEVLVKSDLAPMADRFEAPISLHSANQEAALQYVVAERIAPSYRQQGFTPPYPTYPFQPEFFAYRKASTPREVLKACKAHAQRCRRKQELIELGGAEAPVDHSTTIPPGRDDDAFANQLAHFRKKAPLAEILADESERQLDLLVEAACRAIVVENPTEAGVEAIVDTEFTSTASYDPLHARVRLLLTQDGERERHLSLRFLDKAHYRAFQARLKAAITAAGIDRELPFRRLSVLRREPVPSGKATAALVRELDRRGGLTRRPSDDELRTLWAIGKMLEDQAPHLDDWLADARPVSRLESFREDVAWLFDGHLLREQQGGREPSREPEPSGPKPNPIGVRVPKPDATIVSVGDDGELLLGHRVTASGPGEALCVPLASLRNHVCVLAGSGSGKTVFLKRIIENAVLLGVPAIVLDGANDLVRLGTPWPEPPSAWDSDDPGRAESYFRRAEIVVWTPGRVSGNPIFLDPLPDFASIRAGGDGPEVREELDAARMMASASLEPVVAPGRSAKATKARAILKVALREVSRLERPTLDALVRHLIEPSDDVVGLYKNGESIAREAGELLMAAMQNDPLLGGDGPRLDPGLLLRASQPGRVRVSVISLAGLPDGAPRQSFVNQLAMALFAWVKKHPAQGALSGLFVVDEAKDFVPSNKSVVGKESLVRLAAQARKYGLGLLFASQAPKSIDHNVVANCATLLIGKQSSSTAIGAAEELLSSKGGHVSDVGRLSTGTFYAAPKDAGRPVKVATPLCLSHHPSSPPSEEEVLERARQSREIIGT